MIRIEYTNVCDLDSVLFSAGYVQNIYLDVEKLYRPEYEYFEDGKEDRNRNFIESFKKQTKRQIFRVFATENMADCLQNIQLCKQINIEIDGIINKCDMFSCQIIDEVKGGNYLIECSYQADQIISTGCCSNIRATECLETNVDDVIGLIECDSDEYTNPQANITTDSRYLVDFSNCESKTAQGYNIEIMVYSVSRNEWGHSEDNSNGNYVYNSEDGVYYYYNGDTWKENPKIDSITNVSGNVYTIVGTSYIGYVRIEYSTNGGVLWSELDSFLSAEFINGVDITLLTTYTHIRAVYYTHSCSGLNGASTVNPNADDLVSVATLPLNTFNFDIGAYSDEQSITVTEGVDATTNAVLTAPSGFEISQTSGSGFTDVITLTVGYVSDVIYIRAYSEVSSNITIVVDSITFNVPVVSNSVCDIEWAEDLIDDINVEVVSGNLEDKINYVDGTKTAIATSINAKGGSVTAATNFRDYSTAIDGLVSEGWNPPTDWGWDTASALISDTDDGFVALVAVFPNKTNYISFRMDYTGSGGTIDWGDGTTSALGATATISEKTLNYAGVSGTVTDKGYKVGTLKIVISGTLTAVYFAVTHSNIGTVYNYTTPYLAIKQRSQAASMTYRHNNPYVAGMLELLDLGTTAEVNPYVTFRGHPTLKKITWLPTTAAFSAYLSWASAFTVPSLVSAFVLDDINWSLCTTMQQCFYYAIGNLGTFEQAIDNVTDLTQAWRASQLHNSVILTNTGSVTNLTQAIYECSVSYFSMDDASAVTTTTLFVRNANGYGQLTNLILTGLTVGIDLSYQAMDATAIDALFTSLGTASGAQTIIVTGNSGAATCNTAIATGKGFTVTT